MKQLLTVLLLVCGFLLSYSQIILDDPSLNRNFNAEVKSVDEFISRFNGYESHPEIINDSESGYNNIIALFDVEGVMNSKDKDLMTANAKAFCDSVVRRNVILSISDRDIYAVARSKVKFHGKELDVDLILQHQVDREGYHRWGISHVKGLRRTGIIKNRKSFNISPVEHEIHFMGLTDILNNNTDKAFGYISLDNQIDQTSVFLALIQERLLEFMSVEDVDIYCFKVPGFIFRISEFVRESTNSGWLISELTPSSDSEKTKFIFNLCNEE